MELFSLFDLNSHNALKEDKYANHAEDRKKGYKKCLNDHAGSGNSENSRCFFWIGWSQQFHQFHFYQKNHQ